MRGPYYWASPAAIWRSSALRTAAIFGSAGLAFSGANLILARVLPYGEYGLFALSLAILNLGIPIAPLGMDGMVNRYPVRPGLPLLRRSLWSSAFIAGVVLLTAWGGYGLPTVIVLLLPIGVVAGGMNWVAAAYLQSVARFRSSLALLQASNGVVLGAAVLTAIAGVQSGWVPLSIVVAGYAVTVVIGWSILRHTGPHTAGVAVDGFRRSEMLSYVGVTGAVIVLGQLERLLLPGLLGLKALAVFGVLAATVGSVFRILLLGVGYSLLPRLRMAADVEARRRLIGKEARAVLALAAVAAVLIWYGTPWIVRTLLGGKYVLPASLIFATLVSGFVRVAGSFAKTIVVAVGSESELRQLNYLGWGSVAVAIAGGVVGAAWGLTGVVYGIAVGWMCQALSAAALARVHLRPSEGGEVRQQPTVPVS